MTSPIGQGVTEGTLIWGEVATPGKPMIANLPESNEVTLKKLMEDGGKLILKPLNPGYPIETFDEHHRITGVVVRAPQKF